MAGGHEVSPGLRLRRQQPVDGVVDPFEVQEPLPRLGDREGGAQRRHLGGARGVQQGHGHQRPLAHGQTELQGLGAFAGDPSASEQETGRCRAVLAWISPQTP